ncbi:hypothetical protein KNO15_10210 [Leifsonia shinshuensis]|uniref:hypothetical protein n=1 Tax=Leifsonia shinshuensis TaxID=150026 RepID=UPI001F509DF2|nr:hypothetical protein [Leifsonia shinshuensis]MCI0157068.1 hypothetical protein [Leifsonia shinshuensis]
MTDDDDGEPEAADLIVLATFVRGRLVLTEVGEFREEDWADIDGQLARILTSRDRTQEKSRAIWQLAADNPMLEEQLRRAQYSLESADTSPPGRPSPIGSTIWTCPVAKDVRRLQQYPDQDMGACPTHGDRLVREVP